MSDAPFNNIQPNHTHANLNDEIINHEQFEEMHDLLEEDFSDLVTTYIIDSKKRVALLRSAQIAGDNANGFEAAHAIKGSSANLGATQLMNLGAQLQEACRENIISQCADLVEQTAAAVALVEQEILQRLEQS